MPLSTFHVDCDDGDATPSLWEYLLEIGVSNQALRLEYLAISYLAFRCWKRVGEKWVRCDKTGPESLVDF
jgi:hypothetical protein